MPELLIKDTLIWTKDGIRNYLHINDNVILSVGSGDPPLDSISKDCEIVSLKGKYVLPGLIDSHLHVMYLGKSKLQLDLKQAKSLKELQDALRDYVKEKSNLPKEDLLVGEGWDQDYMGMTRYPTREDLDIIVSDRPVLLIRNCQHICVVNTRGLELLGYKKNEIPGDVAKYIDVDGDGNPTGILRELVCLEAQKKEKSVGVKALVKKGLEECVKNGLTAVQTNDPSAWDAYKSLQTEGHLPVRVFLTIPLAEMPAINPNFSAPQPNEHDHLLSCHRVKIFADGSLGAETAALHEPYHGSHNCGLLLVSDEEMAKQVGAAHSAGYRLEIHVIGDKAASAALNGIEKAGVAPKDRPILTHCQVLSKELIDRMAKAGAIANVQPSFIVTDALWLEKRLGKHTDRLKFSYAWKTLLDSGVYVTGGSDTPVESVNPFEGIHAAIYRRRIGAPPEETYNPKECLTFEEAIHLYTEAGAYTAGREKDLGQLAAGFKADFVVIDKEIWSDPLLCEQVNVEQVWVDGILRYDKSKE